MKLSLFKIFIFIFVGIVLYCFICFIVPQKILSIKSTGLSQYTLTKFREINQVKNVDLLLVGSSHVYRGLDTRNFEKAGYKVFNLGTTAQTPLNSYYLLKEYIPQKKPKLVILEIYHYLFQMDGLESFLDITLNHDLNLNLIQMSLNIDSPRAINTITSEFFKRLKNPLKQRIQHPVENDIYINGGFVETSKKINLEKTSMKIKPREIKINPKQMLFFQKILSFLKEKDVEVFVISQPIPKYHQLSASNYSSIMQSVQTLTNKYGFKFKNYQEELSFDDKDDFIDNNHLNQNAVNIYNTKIIEDLEKFNI